LVGIDADIALTGGFIDHDGIDIAGEEGLDHQTKFVKGLDPVRPDEFFGDSVVGGADLGADEEVGVGGKLFGFGEAIFVEAGQQADFKVNVAIGEVNDFSTVRGDGDAVGGHIERTFADGDDHTIPASFDELRHTVEAVAHFLDEVIVPAGRFTGVQVDVVEGQIGVFNSNTDGLATQIG
jgi:hypothetical protein